MPFLRPLFAAVVVFLGVAQVSMAQDSPFSPGWDLQAEASSLKFQSIKQQTKIETSSFATMSGQIDETGLATITILLDSVDTKVDLRNVRMRFLFFETFKHPEAVITVQIAPELIADLVQVRRKTITLPYTISLHGVTKTLEAPLALTLIGDDLVAVSNQEPITLAVADFDLTGGLKKLEEAADVTIVPSTTINFDFLFQKSGGSTPQVVAAAAPANPASAALEAEGDFSAEACIGRFEILSRTGNIYFGSASARLDSASEPLLQSVVDIVSRCPDMTIQVAGHTDSIGSSGANQTLSERRANSVANYLIQKGISANRMVAVGFGEARPVLTNDTAEGRSRNRRIEFAAIGR